MLDAFNKKRMYVSVITGKENASEDWNCITSMFLTSWKWIRIELHHISFSFVFDYSCFICVCLKTVIWIFLVLGLAFCDERLATLS